MKKFDNHSANPDLCNKNKEMKRPPFSEKMKLADVLHADYRLLLLLPRFGLDLGFGDKTVGECCKAHDITASLFLMICNIYTCEHYLPSEKEIRNTDVRQLVSYLERSHAYYLEKRLNAIRNQLQIIACNCEAQHKKILNRFFEEYRKEVINHFEYEEKTVFPYVLNMSHGNKTAGYEIEIFERNHSNIDDKLNDLKNIIIKYLPGNSSPIERTNVLFDIFSLEEDLSKHSLIEDKILIPLVQNLEEEYGKY